MKKSIGDLLFDRHFHNRISPDSIKHQDREDHEFFLAACIAYVLKFKRINNPAPQLNFSDIKEHSLELFHQLPSSKDSVIRYIKTAVAASVLLLIGLGGYIVGKKDLFFSDVQNTEVIEFSTPKGKQSDLTLPDGTFVTLNYDSRLKYHLASGKTLQKVELEGEAFFQVMKNKSRTFYVVTSDMNVQVLGTTFNIRSYKNDLKTEAVLLEGRIKIVNVSPKEDPITLNPGEKWSFNRTTRQQAISKVNPRLSTLWRNGEYYFDKVTLGELAKTLERMYQVTIHFVDPDLKGAIYSGSVYQDDGIDKVFAMINMTVPVKVETLGDQVLVRKR